MNTTNIPRRLTKTAAEIAEALNKALHAHPECKGVRVLKLTTIEGSEGVANWDADFSTEPGVTMSPERKRRALSAKLGVQKHYDLVRQTQAVSTAPVRGTYALPHDASPKARHQDGLRQVPRGNGD